MFSWLNCSCFLQSTLHFRFRRSECKRASDGKNVVKIELRLPEFTSWEVLECKVLGGTGSVTRLHFLSFVHFCKSSRLAFRAAIFCCNGFEGCQILFFWGFRVIPAPPKLHISLPPSFMKKNICWNRSSGFAVSPNLFGQKIHDVRYVNA